MLYDPDDPYGIPPPAGQLPGPPEPPQTLAGDLGPPPPDPPPSPTRPQRPTQPWPDDGSRPPHPGPDPLGGEVYWDPTWWDGKSPYLGGWLVRGGRTSPSPPKTPTGGVGDFNYGGGFSWPSFQSAGPFSPSQPTFSYDPFTPSTWEEAEQEPGFQAARKRLREQVEAGAAYKGILRSGMTLGDIYSNLEALNNQNFRAFDERRFRNWGANRDLAQQIWADRYGVEKDIYAFGAQDVDRANNFRFNVAKSEFDASVQKWLEQIRSLTAITTAGLGAA